MISYLTNHQCQQLEQTSKERPTPWFVLQTQQLDGEFQSTCLPATEGNSTHIANTQIGMNKHNNLDKQVVCLLTLKMLVNGKRDASASLPHQLQMTTNTNCFKRLLKTRLLYSAHQLQMPFLCAFTT